MTTVTAEAAPRSTFGEVWLISAGHMMTHWYPATFYLLLPLIGNELGLSFSQIGSILTCQYAAGALSNVPGGMVVDAVGRKGLQSPPLQHGLQDLAGLRRPIHDQYAALAVQGHALPGVG